MNARKFLAPKWVIGHVIVLAAAITMIFLGRWQLDVSNSKHFDLQNFGYALQWWAFSIFAVVMWLKVLRDIAKNDATTIEDGRHTDAPPDEPPAYRSYAMPQSATAPTPVGDSVQNDYNAYLAGLAEKADQ